MTQYWSDFEILLVTTGEEMLADGDTLPGALEVEVPCRDTCGPCGKCVGGLGCSSCARALAPTSVTWELWLGPACSTEHQQHLCGREVDTLLTMCREPVLMWSRLVGVDTEHGLLFGGLMASRVHFPRCCTSICPAFRRRRMQLLQVCCCRSALPPALGCS